MILTEKNTNIILCIDPKEFEDGENAYIVGINPSVMYMKENTYKYDVSPQISIRTNIETWCYTEEKGFFKKEIELTPEELAEQKYREKITEEVAESGYIT